jgi:hypothetical protein
MGASQTIAVVSGQHLLPTSAQCDPVECSGEPLKIVTLRHLPFRTVYLFLANIDLPEYYLVLVAG